MKHCIATLMGILSIKYGQMARKYFYGKDYRTLNLEGNMNLSETWTTRWTRRWRSVAASGRSIPMRNLSRNRIKNAGSRQKWFIQVSFHRSNQNKLELSNENKVTMLRTLYWLWSNVTRSILQSWSIYR